MDACEWLTERGVPYDAARAFLSGYCVELANETSKTTKSFTAMIEYLMPPGGHNEQQHAELTSLGAYRCYGDALARVYARVPSRVAQGDRQPLA